MNQAEFVALIWTACWFLAGMVVGVLLGLPLAFLLRARSGRQAPPPSPPGQLPEWVEEHRKSRTFWD